MSTHIIALDPSAGFEQWQRLDIRQMFDYDTIEIGRIAIVHIAVDKTPTFGGDEFKIYGMKLWARCAESGIEVWMNKFATINKELQLDVSRPSVERPEVVWQDNIAVEDWEPRPPCSHFEQLSVIIELFDKFWSGTSNDLYAIVGSERFRVAHQPKIGAVTTTTIDLEKAYGSKPVALANMKRVSIKSEGGHDDVRVQKMTLHGLCVGLRTAARFVIERGESQWIADGEQWDVHLLPQSWAKYDPDPEST
ncbi:hypothetical protein XA68_10517 [Ophiocordyceps unilateralis]|uniref:Uncharacterized protein n=1 Tax=Ophiocordyceps unilateralis TaxID=268505 RepID=A0A2A9P1T8_OPHUN|nr:hypothetical protein XA68_10517 [Ophiocordyceps unilateralis]